MSKKTRGDSILAAAVVVISVCAFAVSIFQARVMQEQTRFIQEQVRIMQWQQDTSVGPRLSSRATTAKGGSSSW